MANYYDIILGLIPLSMIGITGVLLVADFGLTTAIPLAGIVSVGLIGHAMFVRAPVDPRETQPTEQVESNPMPTGQDVTAD